MTTFIDNGVWDKSGACVDCGFIPFKLSDECYVCNPPSNISDEVKNNCDEENCREEICGLECVQGDITWAINREKSIIIDEDTSTYEEMFEALKAHNYKGYVEEASIVEEQIYRRFIKDISLNKFTNINTIMLAANKIYDVIIKPDDGTRGAWSRYS
jgi:hypothetical protein